MLTPPINILERSNLSVNYKRRRRGLDERSVLKEGRKEEANTKRILLLKWKARRLDLHFRTDFLRDKEGAFRVSLACLFYLSREEH